MAVVREPVTAMKTTRVAGGVHSSKARASHTGMYALLN